ncbi:MAG: hypothetical protein A3F74_27690 [Betaproteobacteria bacterium RIFCSPLOWO2_12_FULL_62_58]|nr:MAG: hypothetical protein A3F74_27690 [Betaproteobacteria bacterium RIFCSPLOWO2_12_FULL_62_58]
MALVLMAVDVKHRYRLVIRILKRLAERGTTQEGADGGARFVVIIRNGMQCMGNQEKPSAMQCSWAGGQERDSFKCMRMRTRQICM